MLLLVLGGCGDDEAAAGTKLARSPSVETRREAAARLGALGTPEAARLLVAHGLKDPVAAVRAEAVAALGGLGDRRVVDVLGERLDDPAPEVQAAAALALGRRGTDQALHHLELGYSRSGSPGRVTIAQALVEAGGSPSRAVETDARRRMTRNLEALRTGSPAERVGAAEALGRSGTREAVAALLPLLASRSVAVASAAARGLGLARARGAVGTLGRLLEEPYPELQASVAEALGRIGDPAAVPALTEALESSGARRTEPLVAALAAIAGQGGQEAPEALCHALVGLRSAAVAGATARALRELGAPCEPAEALGRALARPGPRRRAALHAVAGLGHPALDEAGRERLRVLLTSARAEEQPLVWAAAAAVHLPDAGDAALAALQAAREADEAAREVWVGAGLPQDDTWGRRFLAEDAPVAREDLTRLMGLRSRREGTRHAALLEKVAAYRARLEGQALMAGASSGERDQAAAQADHLAALTGGNEVAGAELFPQAAGPQDGLLAAVAEAAGVLAGAAAVPSLKPLCAHPDPLVRQGALRGLAAVDTPESTQALVDVVQGELPGDAVARAAAALGERHAVLPAVEGRLDRMPAEALPAVARAIGEGGGESARPLLETLLTGPAAAEAAVALGHLAGAESTRILVAHVLLGRPGGRLEAVEALARSGRGGRVAQALREALHDVRPEVRAAASRGLRRIGLADPWLEALTRDYDLEVRMAAMGA